MANFTVSLQETTEDMRATDRRSEAGAAEVGGGVSEGRREAVRMGGESVGGGGGGEGGASRGVTVKAEGRR